MERAPDPRIGSFPAGRHEAPARVGLLMLDTRFPRLAGDIGHPATFDPPALLEVVAGASPKRVVLEGDATLLEPFVAAGRRLVARGATTIATSCGFLVRFQHELQAALPVPVRTSSLLLVPALDAALALSGRRAGILTVDAASLTHHHLRAAGARDDTPVEGLAEDSALRRTLLENRAELDADEAREATVAAALRLVRRHPEVGAIVLECTNLPPYAQDVQRATGLPVHDLASSGVLS